MKKIVASGEKSDPKLLGVVEESEAKQNYKSICDWIAGVNCTTQWSGPRLNIEKSLMNLSPSQERSKILSKIPPLFVLTEAAYLSLSIFSLGEEQSEIRVLIEISSYLCFQESF